MSKQALTPARLHIENRGLPLTAHVWGQQGAPILLCFHGFLDHGLSFAPIAERLADQFCIVAPDARGHGASGWIGAGGQYMFYDYYQDAVRWLQLLDQPQVTVIGHSMGGMIAAGLAALRPDRVSSVVLLDGMGPTAKPANTARSLLHSWIAALEHPVASLPTDERRRSRKAIGTLDDAVAALQAYNPRLSTTMARQLAVARTESVGGQLVWRHDPLHHVPGARPFRVDEASTLWQAMTMPVLSIYAELSEWRIEDLAFRHSQLPDVTVASLAGVGHNLHHEQPALLADAIALWVSQRRVVSGLTVQG